MKKIYFMALALGAFAFTANAQIEAQEDFEDLNFGPVSSQSSVFRTWSGDEGTTEDGEVSGNQANSGIKSLLIGNNEVTDQLVLVESQPTTGVYTVQFNMYVPSGNEGYFNLQGEITEPQTQAILGGNIYWNPGNGLPGEGCIAGGLNCNSPIQSFSFSHDTWNLVTLRVDIDAQTFSMLINGEDALVDVPWNDADQPYFGGIDLFSSSAVQTAYYDDFVLAQGVLGVDDFSADVFSVYPNPVQDILNIQSRASVDSVVVYDVLGKRVLSVQPDAISPSIDMSNLRSGAYMVNVTIGNATKTIKVMK